MKKSDFSDIGIFLKVFSIAVLLCITDNSHSQKGATDGSRYGHGTDSIECIKNLTLYREYIRFNDFESAYPYWQIVFNDCPTASKNIYIDGIKMLRYKLDSKVGKDLKETLLDSLMLIYGKRIQYYGDEGEVIGKQGIDLLYYSINNNIDNSLKAYNYIKKAIELQKMNVSESVLANLVSASLWLYKNKKLNYNELLQDYILSTEIISTIVESNPSPQLLGLKNDIEENFNKVIHSNCDSLVLFFCDALKIKERNISYLTTITSILRNRNCTQSDLYYDCSKQLYELSPGSESAQNMAILSYNKEKYSEAMTYYKQAAELEKVNDKKAEIYYNLAIISNKTGNKPMARDYAYKALDLRKSWGEPYLFIGQLYADSRELCASVSLPDAIFWIAVDMFDKAKLADPSVEAKADKLINIYSKYYPNVEEAFFANVTEGKTYTIECWINETTKARFNN